MNYFCSLLSDYRIGSNSNLGLDSVLGFLESGDIIYKMSNNIVLNYLYRTLFFYSITSTILVENLVWLQQNETSGTSNEALVYFSTVSRELRDNSILLLQLVSINSSAEMILLSFGLLLCQTQKMSPAAVGRNKLQRTSKELFAEMTTTSDEKFGNVLFLGFWKICTSSSTTS